MDGKKHYMEVIQKKKVGKAVGIELKGRPESQTRHDREWLCIKKGKKKRIPVRLGEKTG